MSRTDQTAAAAGSVVAAAHAQLLVQLEEELAAAGLPPEREDRLRCQLALLCWDGDDPSGDAAVYLMGASAGHRLASELMRQVLLDRRDAVAAADLLVEQAAVLGDDPAAAQLLAEAALLQLLWLLDTPSTIELVQQALEAPQPAGGLTELYELALGAADEIELLATQALTEDLVTLSTLVDGALALWDRLGRPELALDLMLRAHDLDDSDPFILELLIEASVRFPEVVDRVEFLGQKHRLLTRHGGRSPELAAVAFELCRLLSRSGQNDRAEELWSQAAEVVGFALRSAGAGDTLRTVGATEQPGAGDGSRAPAGDPAGAAQGSCAAIQRWAELGLTSLRRDLALHANDAAALSAAYLAMAGLSGVPAWARIYRLRGAQAGERAGVLDFDQLEHLLEQNLEESNTDLHAATMLQRMRLRQRRPEGLCAQFQDEVSLFPERKSQLLRWAAIVAEAHLEDLPLAASLRRDALLVEPDPFGAGDLQRLYRRSRATGRLIDAYRRDADNAQDVDRLATVCLALAALHLREGALDEAAALAREVLVAVPEDVGALLVLAMALRAKGRTDELQEVLALLVELLRGVTNRQACLRELAALESDAAVACRYLEQSRLMRADDLPTLVALAARYEQSGALAEAGALQLEIGRLADTGPAAAAALRQAGRIFSQVGDAERALQAYREALQIAPDDQQLLGELEAIYRARGDLPGLLDVLQQQLTPQLQGHGRAALLRKIGETLEQVDGAEPEAILAVCCEAAKLEPERDDGLLALQRVCRVHERQDLLADTLAELPPRVLVLDLRAEALERLDELEDLAAVRRQLLDLAADGRDRADRAYDLGRAHERLRQIDEALAAYQQGLAEVADHRPSLRALQRIYQAAGDAEALEQVLEQEYATETDGQRQVDLLIELARCSAHRGDVQLASARLEQALEHAPDNREVIDALERAYEATRPVDHARLLQHRAGIETRPAIRSGLYQRAAEILLDTGDEHGAAEAYAAAMRESPGNRDCFTAYERFCYEREQWRELMEMYEAAIRHVEGGGERVYRLSDLYVRRGQLQLEQLAQPGEAAASFLKVLEFDPKSVSAMNVLQNIFVQQQDWRGLIRAYEHRARLLPDNELFRLESLRQAARLASARLAADDPDTMRLWSEVFDVDPTDAEAAERLEDLYDLHGEHQRLADLLETCLQLQQEPDREQLLQLAALAERKLDDPGRAARAYEAVRRIAEHDEEALKELARIYEATGDWARCLEALQGLVLIEADPEERSLLYFKCGSITEVRFADNERAIAYYESSLDESPGCLPALHSLRDLYLRRGQWFDALRTLEHELRLWEGEREEAGVLARMAEIRLRHLQDEAKAIEEFEDALALDPDCRPALCALFDLYYERGERARALRVAERLAPQLAKEGEPEERSRFFGRQGELLAAAAGEQIAADGAGPRAAAESLVTALRLQPGNVEALEKLIELFRCSPEAYEYALAFRELEQVYRSENDTRALGHVLVAAGALSEMASDADAALEIYQQAEDAAPELFAPVRVRADLLVRLGRVEQATAVLLAFLARVADSTLKIQTLAMLGELAADVEMDAEQGAQRYAEMLALDPMRLDVALRLAQELYLLGRYQDAQRTMERLVAQSQEAGCSEVDQARYHHYLGVTLLRTQGPAEAAASFRRALQLDPACAEAAMALSRRLVQTGAREQAEELLAHSIHETSGRRQREAVLDLRRTLCGIYLGDGRFDEALGEYAAVIAEGGGQVEDHLTVAEIYALEDASIPQALERLRLVLEQDPFNPHAFKMMAQLYDRLGEMDRTMQVLQVTEVLGLVGEEDRARVVQLRQQLAWKPARILDERLRQLALVPGQDAFVERLWNIARSSLERVFPLELPAPKPQSADQVGLADFRLTVNQCLQLQTVRANVQVGHSVPGGVVSDSVGDRVIIDRLLLQQPLTAVAFGLGRSLELLRSGHALVGRLAVDDRMLLVELLQGLLEQPEERSDLAEEFIRRLPRRAAEQLEEAAADYQQQLSAGGAAQQALRWIENVERNANHFGLIACDNIGAALRMMAMLSQQEQALGPRGEVVVQALSDGPELIQFYLSDNYVRLRRQLARVV